MIVHFMNNRPFSKTLSSNSPKMVVHFINDRSFSKKISSNLAKMIVHFINDRPFYEWSSVFQKIIIQFT